MIPGGVTRDSQGPASGLNLSLRCCGKLVGTHRQRLGQLAISKDLDATLQFPRSSPSLRESLRIHNLSSSKMLVKGVKVNQRVVLVIGAIEPALRQPPKQWNLSTPQSEDDEPPPERAIWPLSPRPAQRPQLLPMAPPDALTRLPGDRILKRMQFHLFPLVSPLLRSLRRASRRRAYSSAYSAAQPSSPSTTFIWLLEPSDLARTSWTPCQNQVLRAYHHQQSCLVPGDAGRSIT